MFKLFDYQMNNVKKTEKEKIIERWKEDHPIQKPKTVRLKDYSEYDESKHGNCLIEFSPSGQVGDHEWRMQYMHNIRVMTQYQNMRDGPTFTSETYIMISDDDLKKILYVDTIIGEFLINRYDINMIMIYRSLVRTDIKYVTPLTYNPNFNKVEDILFLDLYEKCASKEQTKVVIKYENGTEKDITDDIQKMEYVYNPPIRNLNNNL